MTIIWLALTVFILLLILPILSAGWYYKKHKGEVLFINQEKNRDPRYFGKAFAALVENNLGEAVNGSIKLSREEPYIDADKQKEYPESVDRVVIGRDREFVLSGKIEFRKEIYSRQNVSIAGEVVLRAVYSRKDMAIGSYTEIVRWADAEGTVAVYDDCDLGISVSSNTRMSIGQNCKFRRLYAPEIYIGQYPGGIEDPARGKDERIYRLSVQMDREKNIRYINKEMVNEEGVVDFSVLSWKNVSVTERIIVKGDIRSHKGVRLCEGAIVVGNVFAEKDIILEAGACILGNAFSQENIYMARGAAVGKQGAVSSVIARGKIEAEPGTFVFGYMSCEKQGSVLTKRKKDRETPPAKGQAEEISYLEKRKPVKLLRFKDLEDYEGVDQQGYRFQHELEEVIIPAGARRIPRSMFFQCTSLKSIQIPESIEEIDDYAFAGCRNLRNVSLDGKNSLQRIGVSAFENCRELENITIPQSLKTLGAAAFAGCSNLGSVTFAEGSHLETVEDHCFQGCVKLGELTLPNQKEEVTGAADEE